jgi:hypothetical protein
LAIEFIKNVEGIETEKLGNAGFRILKISVGNTSCVATSTTNLRPKAGAKK